MVCVCRRDNARSDWLIVTELQGIIFGPVMPTGRLLACARTIGYEVIPSAALAFLLYFCVPYNKQLNNLDRSVVMGKSQTWAYHIDRLAIAWSIRRGLSLRFSGNDLTLGY